MSAEIDTTNRFAVASGGKNMLLLNPPRMPFSPDEALVLAAWLVVMAEPFATISFEAAREAVEST